MSQVNLPRDASISITTQNQNTGRVSTTDSPTQTQEAQASTLLAQQISVTQRDNPIVNASRVNCTDIKADPASVQSTIVNMNQSSDPLLRTIKVQMEKSSIEGLQVLDQAYASVKDDSKAVSQLDQGMSKIIAKSLVSKSQLEKLADKINSEIVSKFEKNKLGDNEELFAKIVYDKFRQLDESLKSPDKSQRALANIEGLKILLQDSQFPASEGLLTEFDRLAYTVKTAHSDMLANQTYQNDVQALIDRITGASTSQVIKDVKKEFDTLVKKFENSEPTSNERTLLNSLEELIINKTSRLARIDEVSTAITQLKDSKKLATIDTLTAHFQAQQDTFIGLAGQDALTQQEAELTASIQNLKDSFEVLKTVQELRQKLSPENIEQFNTFLQKIHYHSEICDSLNKLSSDELSSIISKISQLKNTQIFESYKIAIANMPALINTNQLLSLIDSAIDIQNEPSTKNYNKAFNQINSFFMDKAENFNADFAHALKSDLLPAKSPQKAKLGEVDPHTLYSTIMNKQHKALIACNDINKALERNGLRSLALGDKVNSGALFELLNDYELPKTIDNDPIDMLIMSTCYQLAEAEKLLQGKSFNAKNDFHALLPKALSNNLKDILPDISHLGFISQKQVLQFQTALTISQKMSALKDFSTMISKLSKDDVERVQDSIMRLAQSLNVPVKDGINKRNIQDITKDCSVRFQKTLQGVYEGVQVHKAYVQQMELVRDLTTSFKKTHSILPQIADAQKLKGSQIDQINGGKLPGSLVAVQRLLVNSLDELSAFDLKLLRIKKDALKDSEIRDFTIRTAVENLFKANKTPLEKEVEANNLTTANWQKSWLLLEYKKLPDNKYDELCKANLIQDYLIKSVADLEGNQTLRNLNSTIRTHHKEVRKKEELAQDKLAQDILQTGDFGFGKKKESPVQESKADSLAQTIDLLKTLAITGNQIRLNFQEARSYNKMDWHHAKGEFDDAGRIFHTLLQSFISEDGTKGVKLNGRDSNFVKNTLIINGVEFSRNPVGELVGYNDKEKIRQALIDILNGEKIVVQKPNSNPKKEDIIEDISYLPPMESAYCVLSLATSENAKVDKKNPPKSRMDRVEDIVQNIFTEDSNLKAEIASVFNTDYVTSKEVDSVVVRSMRDLFQDLVIRVGYNDILTRQETQSADAYKLELSQLFDNPEFTKKLLPLVVMNSFANSGASSITDFAYNISEYKDIVINSFKDQNVPAEVAPLLFELLAATKSHIIDVEKTLDYAVGAYAYASLQSVVASVFGNGIESTSSKDLRADSLKVLRQIPKSSELNLSSENTASLSLSSKISPITVGLAVGKVDGMNLTRDEAGNIRLSVANGLFAEGKVGASFADIASVDIAGKVAIKQDLTFSFTNDEACASFMGEFLSGNADMHSLKLCSSVSGSKGGLISGEVEVAGGLKYEKENVFTVQLGARARATGEWSFNVADSGKERTTTTSNSFSIGAAVGTKITFDDPSLKKLEEFKDVAEKIAEVKDEIIDLSNTLNDNIGRAARRENVEKIVETENKIVGTVQDTRDLLAGKVEEDNSSEEEVFDQDVEVLKDRGYNLEGAMDINSISFLAQATFSTNTSQAVKRDILSDNILEVVTTHSSNIGGSNPTLSACYFAKELGISEEKIVRLKEQLEAKGLSEFTMVCTRKLSDEGINAINLSKTKKDIVEDSSYLDDYVIHIEHPETRYSDSTSYLGVFINQSQAKATQRIDINLAA